MFDRNLDRFGKNTALIQNGIKVTYEELEKKVNDFCNLLDEEKELVAFFIEPTIQNIVAYLGFLRKNYAVLMIDKNLDIDLKKNILNEYKPNLIYENENFREFNTQKLDIHKELSLLLPTSGSTGSSKYVRLTKKNLYANAESITGYLPITQNDTAITSLPLHYSYGLSVLHTHLLKGAKIVLSDMSLMQREFWEEFDKHGVTNFNGVPYHYEMLYRLKFDFKKHPSIKFATQAGGKLNQKYVLHFAKNAKEAGVEFYVMYGQTEATARISYLPPHKTLEKPSSIGIAIPGGKIEFIDNELVYSGENVMLGYATSYKDLKKGDELNSVLHTGDLGYKDEEGYSYITGRAKRFIKMFGNRINLDECEHFLKSKYKDVYLVGIDNHITVFSLDDDKEALELLKKKYKFNSKALSFKKIDEFPSKSNGKIDYQKLIKIAYGE